MTLIKNYFDLYHPRYFVAKVLLDGDKLKLIEHSLRWSVFEFILN